MCIKRKGRPKGTGKPLEERFWSKVDRQPNGCWVWNGSRTPNGYGTFRDGDKGHCAHRLSYQLIKGDIPTGLVLDHLCRNKACVNPDHLEPVTYSENVKRGDHTKKRMNNHNKNKTHCNKGHPLSGNNLYVSKLGRRHCKQCERDRRRIYSQLPRDILSFKGSHQEAWFWSQIKRTPECWIWSGPEGSINEHGFARITFRAHTYMVHRLSYELLRGPLNENKQYIQSCGNRLCVNPKHLIPLTETTTKLRDRGTPEERFWGRVEKQDDGCWGWTGPVQKESGYGRICIDYKRVPVHRYAYELLQGPLDKGKHVLHKCGNKLCVNPDHLTTMTTVHQ